MKKSSLFIFLALALALCLSPKASALSVVSASRSVLDRAVMEGGSLPLAPSDFAGADTLTVVSLPAPEAGALMYLGSAVEPGKSFTAADAASLSFVSAPGSAGKLAVFELRAGAGPSVAVAVRTVRADDLSPIAENIDLTTYKGVAAAGTLRAIDPEGGTVTFSILKEPKKGTLTLDGDSFTYTPADGKSGRDSFVYTAADAAGNISAEARVRILIEKQSSSVSYADMDGNAAHYAALKLADEGVFIGRQLGESWFFEPAESVSRGEFLAMCLRACQVDSVAGVSRTGFADDGEIPVWVRPYVSAAVISGVINGRASEAGLVFDASAAITRAEAAVILDNLLGIADAPAALTDLPSGIPDWAAQAVSNLSSCGISSAGAYSEALTRADAAVMLSGAMELLEARRGPGLLGRVFG